MKKYVIIKTGEIILVNGEAKDFRSPKIEMIDLNNGKVISITLKDIEKEDLKHLPWD